MTTVTTVTSPGDKPADWAPNRDRAIVLYVDDDPANRTAFRLIAGSHFAVLLADSGEEGVRLIEQNPDIAVLLSDQRMAKMNGVSLCEHVHATRPEIVRILVTAYSDLRAAVAAINRGHVSLYLRKPWNPDELLAALHESAERYRLKVMVQKLQAKMAESERMAALGVLGASLGHELRTPISIVSSNLRFMHNALSELAQKNTLEEPRAALRPVLDALADAEEGADRLSAVLDGILLSARGQPGEKQPVDLCKIVQTVLRLLRHETRHRAQLETIFHKTPLVLGSATQVGQVLLNLLLNALQALGQTTTGVIRIELDEHDGQAFLAITDNGVGIPPQNLPSLFQPFFTTKPQGTGLGLAIAKRIVEEMAGRIEVQSTQGAGTCFRIVWPVFG